jgi:hypothetical protein
MLDHNEYCDKRERFRLEGVKAEELNDIEKSSYYAGIVRGLDYAFEDGSAKRIN